MNDKKHYPIPVKGKLPSSPYLEEQFGRQAPGRIVKTTPLIPNSETSDYEPPRQPSPYTADGTIRSIPQGKASKHESNKKPGPSTPRGNYGQEPKPRTQTRGRNS